jgi:hypothetical protein
LTATQVAVSLGNKAITRSCHAHIDEGGVEYLVDLLVQEQVEKVLIHVEAKVEWAQIGVVPTTELKLWVILPQRRR